VQKRSMTIVWLLAVTVLAAAVSVAAAEEGTPAAKAAVAAPAVGGAGSEDAAKKAAEPQPPVHISADEAEYFNKDGLAVFTGNVVAVQGDATLTADRMEVTFSQPPAVEGKPAPVAGAASGGQRITGITAQKNVSVRQVDPETKKERYATGDKAVYDADLRLVTMSGSPRMWEGKNVVVGEEMVFHLKDKKVIVKGKVNLTVYPDETKEAKKP